MIMHAITLGLEVRPPSPTPYFQMYKVPLLNTLSKSAAAGILSPQKYVQRIQRCLLYTSDAADE